MVHYTYTELQVNIVTRGCPAYELAATLYTENKAGIVCSAV